MFRGAFCLLPFTFCLFAMAQPTAITPKLMPMPAQMTAGSGALPLSETFSASLTGYTEPRLKRAVDRLYARITAQTGIPLEYGTQDFKHPALVIHTLHASEKVQKLGEDESYRLEVTPAGAKLEAATPLGTMHGLETFLQLIRQMGLTSPPAGETSSASRSGPSSQGSVFFYEAYAISAVTINDKPRFPWRGLLLDACRHWMPPEVVRRTLDGMAAVKMNVLHWHLSEYQGFRVESKKYPKLQGMGSDGLYYTQRDIKDILEYARDRGIRVVPEFDMPGHATSWFVGYPQLASAKGPYEIERRWGVFDPAMDVTRESTYKFLDGFIGEMARLFPDQYFHIGGDEVNGKQWDQNEAIQVFMKKHGLKNNAALQAYFNQRLQKIVRKHGKIMVGWDEILHPDLPKDVVVQSWRGQKSLADAAKQGYRGLLSYGYYLDLGQHADSHYRIDPFADGAANLTPEEQARILGGESCMWAEWVSPETLDSRIWPRNAVIAERLWSAQNVTDIDSMYERMAAESERLEKLGLTHNSDYRPMLERIAGPQAVSDFRMFADAIEPVKGYNRHNSADQRWPLNRLVDAVRPDSLPARRFNKMAEAIAGGAEKPEDRTAVEAALMAWRDAPNKLQPAFTYSSMGAEAGPVVQALAELASAGLDALKAIQSKQGVAAAWKQQQLDAVKKLATQRDAEVVIAVAPGIQKLIEAAPMQ